MSKYLDKDGLAHFWENIKNYFGEEGARLVYDEDAGEYTNQSVHSWLSGMRDGLAYGISVPTGSSTACTKTGANEGIDVPVCGTIGTPAVDPYQTIAPFMVWDVNGYVDSDGMPHVTAIDGDGRFKRDGTNGNVWVMAPVLYYADGTATNAVTLSISDTQLAGMQPQPAALLPDGTLRPFMLYAKYAGSIQDGTFVSVSGVPTTTRTISHNSLITQCSTASTGYAGLSYADLWYIQTMFLMKYATKNSQSKMAGCHSYNYGYAITVAETGVTHVTIATSNAANLLVGSTVCVGAGATDKSNSVCDNAKILSITASTDSNSIVALDTITAFDTDTTLKLYTMPWHTGATDAVQGDGSPSSNSSGKEPFKLQGIELMVGCYETVGDIICNCDSNGEEAVYNKDSKNEATSVTANYTHSGKYLPQGSSDGWQYPLYPDFSTPVPFCAGTGGNTSNSGMCDGFYTKKTGSTGTYEWLAFGYLYLGASAGLWFVSASSGLGNTGWYIGSRLSANGRKG